LEEIYSYSTIDFEATDSSEARDFETTYFSEAQDLEETEFMFNNIF
jgi:hypothetical protein